MRRSSSLSLPANNVAFPPVRARSRTGRAPFYARPALRGPDHDRAASGRFRWWVRQLLLAGLLLLTFCTAASAQRIETPPCRLVEDFRFGAFAGARDIAVDAFGDIYVTDESRHMLVKCGRDGREMRAIGGQGWALDQFDQPAGIDARLGITVYVADRGNHRIVRLDRAMHAMGSFTTRDDPDRSQSFGDPLDVAVTRRGTLLVLDGENRRVVSTTGFATIEQSFGSVDAGRGRLVQPVAMVVDDADNVYVLEQSRVVVFDAFGAWRHTFGEGMLGDARGIWLQDGRGWIVTKDRLHAWTVDGRIEPGRSAAELFLAEPVVEFRNVAESDGKVMLLTPTSVILLSCTQ